MGSKLNYGDFTRTGYQDCRNVFDTSSHYEAWRRLGKPRGQAAKKIVKESWGDDNDQYEQWLEQADIGDIVKDDLDPHTAYKAWRDAWQECAESIVVAELKKWIQRDDEDNE